MWGRPFVKQLRVDEIVTPNTSDLEADVESKVGNSGETAQTRLESGAVVVDGTTTFCYRHTMD